MTVCQLRLARSERPECILKNGSSKRGTGGSAIYHQLDRIDVCGIVRGKEEHANCDVLRSSSPAEQHPGSGYLVRVNRRVTPGGRG